MKHIFLIFILFGGFKESIRCEFSSNKVFVGAKEQHYKDYSVFSQSEDELTILCSQKVKSFKPILFEYKYTVQIKNDRVYFYSPYMSQYKKNNRSIHFEIEYI